MENVENQNPYAVLNSSPVSQTKGRGIGRSNECLWLGVISSVGFVTAYLLFYWVDSLSLATAMIANVFAMLLCCTAGAAGVAAFAIGCIEAIAQLASKSVFGQKETVFAGIALSLTGPIILVVQCIKWILQAY